MTDFETSSHAELDPTGQRFTEFVLGHTKETTSKLRGAFRDGSYKITDLRQIIPADKVEFDIFDTDPDYSPGEDYGYAIGIYDGQLERFSLIFSHGEFKQTNGGYDIPFKINPDVVNPFIDALTEAESNGRLQEE